MVYQGTIQNGIVVLPAPILLPNGTPVRVEPVPERRREAAESSSETDPIFRMTELAMETGIPDLATNADHYLYGHPKVDEITHFGVNDALLDNLHATVPHSFTIELAEEEIRALSLLDKVFPDLEDTVGEACVSLLRNGRKIEQEAVVSALGSQTPILKLLAGLPAC
jgi:hypothetical protein